MAFHECLADLLARCQRRYLVQIDTRGSSVLKANLGRRSSNFSACLQTSRGSGYELIGQFLCVTCLLRSQPLVEVLTALVVSHDSRVMSFDRRLSASSLYRVLYIWSSGCTGSSTARGETRAQL